MSWQMQNDFSDEPPVPQLSFDMPTQQSAPNNYYGLAALTTSNRNYDGGAKQLGNYQETQSSGRSTLALPEENITTEQMLQSLQKPVKEVKTLKIRFQH